MFARRLEAIRQRIAESRLRGLLVTSLPNIQYLTGFTGSNAGLLIFPDRALFFTDNRYRIQASREVKGARTIIVSGSLIEALAGKLSHLRRPRIGFEGGSIAVAAYRNLRRVSDRTRFVSTDGFVERVRVRKDATEISRIKRAAEITDRVFKKILAILEPGIRELEIAAEITYWHRQFGAESEAFEPIVASGTRGALPHARASAKKIKKGELVTIDMGCRVEGYHSDLTRTVAVGKPSTRMKRIYGIVLDAQQRAIDGARAGVTARTLDAVARRTIQASGYGKYFNHSLGQGLGLEVHELPRVSSKSTDVLERGSVITIEPGIYIPNVGGVRIEDDVVIQRKNCEVLNDAPKELVVV
jgi:Xaa-Pro aminopeptidase